MKSKRIAMSFSLEIIAQIIEFPFTRNRKSTGQVDHQTGYIQLLQITL